MKLKYLLKALLLSPLLVITSIFHAVELSDNSIEFNEKDHQWLYCQYDDQGKKHSTDLKNLSLSHSLFTLENNTFYLKENDYTFKFSAEDVLKLNNDITSWSNYLNLGLDEKSYLEKNSEAERKKLFEIQRKIEQWYKKKSDKKNEFNQQNNHNTSEQKYQPNFKQKAQQNANSTGKSSDGFYSRAKVLAASFFKRVGESVHYFPGYRRRHEDPNVIFDCMLRLVLFRLLFWI